MCVRTHVGPRVAALEDHAALGSLTSLERRDLLPDDRVPREARRESADACRPDRRGHVPSVQEHPIPLKADLHALEVGGSFAPASGEGPASSTQRARARYTGPGAMNPD